jgi:hypothetical protein
VPLKYDVSPGKKLIVALATGIVTRDDCDAITIQILADKRVHAGINFLLETADVDSRLTFTDLKELAGNLQRLSEKGVARLALVAHSTFLYSLAKTFGVFASKEPVVVKPFRKVADAEKWLKSAA